MTSKNKFSAFKNKMNCEDFEGALNILNELIESYPSLTSELEEKRIIIIKNIFYKLINKKEFDEALYKIRYYERKYYKYKKELIEIKSLIYYNLAEKKVIENKNDEAIDYFNDALNLKPDYDDCKIEIISLLIQKKQLFDEALTKINEIENKVSKEKLVALKKLKALALNNKAFKIPENNKEEAISLINQAIEIIQSDDDLKKVIKKNRFTFFTKLYIEKINEEKYKEIPNLFKEALKYNYLSQEMSDYLNINKYISFFFESLYNINKKKIQKYFNKLS